MPVFQTLFWRQQGCEDRWLFREATQSESKFHPKTGDEGPEGEEEVYSSTLSLTYALGGVGGQRHAPAAIPPGKTRYRLYRRLGEPYGQSGRVRKISPPRDSIPEPSSP